MTKITKDLQRVIEEVVKNSRLTDDDCLTDEEFEEWAGCKRASREEIEEKNREHAERKKKSKRP